MPKSSVSKQVFAASALSLALVSIGTAAFAQTPSLIPQQQAGPLPNGNPTTGVRTMASGATTSAIATAPANFEKLRIQPGFLLHISVFSEPQLSQDLRVNEAGDVLLSLAGRVHVQGMNESAAQDAIAEAYKKSELLKDPQIALSITQYVSTKISILGEVQTAGEYELFGPTDLLTALTMAGGANMEAGNRITLRHAATNEEQVIKFNRSGDTSNLKKFVVNPGDTVVVKRAGIVYVLGAVNRPGGYVMQPDGSMNVIQAIAMALDTNLFASIQSIRIIRKTDDGLIDIPVKYKYIVSGKADPQPLEPDDIVYVPNSKAKLTFANAKQLAFQASGSAIYAGIVH